MSTTTRCSPALKTRTTTAISRPWPKSTASGSPARATASATRCSSSASASRARRSSAPTATRPPAAASACWPSAPVAWTSRSPWAAVRTTSPCRRCSRSTSPACCSPMSRPRTSASSCCASCRSRAASARSSSGAAPASRRCPCPNAPRSRTWAPSSAQRRPSSRRTT